LTLVSFAVPAAMLKRIIEKVSVVVGGVGVLLVGTTTMIDFNFISLLVRMQEVWLS
jgi:uncharacterized protein (DUF39 family)